MASLFQSNHAKGVHPMPVADGSEIVCCRMTYTIAAALVLNDIIEMGNIPAMHLPVDCILDSDDLDSNVSPTITLSAGILNAGKTAVDTTASSGGAAWIAASTVAQAGGIARPTTTAITRVAVDNTNNRSVGVQVAAAPATGATTGTIGLTLMYRGATYGS